MLVLVEVAARQRARLPADGDRRQGTEAAVAAAEEDADLAAVLAGHGEIGVVVAVEVVDRDRGQVADVAGQADDAVEASVAAAAQQGGAVAETVEGQGVEVPVAVDVGEQRAAGPVPTR